MNPRKILRIARWEVGKNAGGIDRKTIAIVVGTGLLLAVLAPLVAASGVAVDEGLYRVSVEDDSPLERVVTNDSTFAVVDEEGALGRDALGEEVDLLVRDTTVLSDPSPKGRAAASELRDSVTRYNDEIMRAEGNQSAAFPVTVTLRYVDRNLRIQTGDGDDSSGGGTGDGGGVGGDGGAGGSGDGSGTGDGSGSGDGSSSGGGDGGGGGLSGLPELARSLTGSDGASGSPSDISPPFPFQSLVLAFVFVLPLNFVIQAYGSTMLSERLNRRGELMLVSPVTRGDIIAGKTLPYFAGAMVFEGLITGGILLLRGGSGGSGLYSIGAVLPLVVLFLGATFLGAMFARSFKELTFVTVAITVGLTTYAFVPAIFTDVTPIALISPLTIIVRDLAGQPITLTAFAFSTLPPFLTAALFFGLGSGLYREEDMFTQRPIPLKVLDALAGRIKRARSLVLLSVILMPFVIVAELLVVALFFALPAEFAIPAILFLIVVIEELAKGLPIYAGFVHRRYDRALATALLVGGLAGLGFFVAEKGLLLVRFALTGVGGEIPQAQNALFQTVGSTEARLGIALLLLLAPLALHTVTAAITAVGGRKGRRGFALGLAGAIVLHFAYNMAIITVVSDLV
jgi:ABC-type Na+ efflux pump permease subunit